MHYGLLIRNATLIDADGRRDGHCLAASDGRIADIAPEIRGSAATEIDARGLVVLPGLIDPHVHFNEPGRIEWEGLASGSAALAAGGGTCFFDMPLNSTPPLLDAVAFDAKRAAAERSSHVDFGLWGGLVPGNVDQLDELAARGVVGFKAFMCDSGIAEFPPADEDTLHDGMHAASRLGLPVAVHAESQALVAEATRRARSAGGRGVRDFLSSRPVAAELDAIERAIELARQTACALHIVHVSCGAGVALVAQARAAGVDVTCETCPHYLFLTEEDVERLGGVAKCAPPVRGRSDQDSLWSELLAGRVDWVASDHSPAPPAMKAAADFFDAWGGIAGCQSTLALLLTEGSRRGLTPVDVARLTSQGAAGRFRIKGKGALRVGCDADVALVDPGGRTEPLAVGHLHYRHRVSPYLGQPLHGVIRTTILRGCVVFDEGRVRGAPGGRLVRGA